MLTAGDVVCWSEWCRAISAVQRWAHHSLLIDHYIDWKRSLCAPKESLNCSVTGAGIISRVFSWKQCHSCHIKVEIYFLMNRICKNVILCCECLWVGVWGDWSPLQQVRVSLIELSRAPETSNVSWEVPMIYQMMSYYQVSLSTGWQIMHSAFGVIGYLGFGRDGRVEYA